MKQELTYEQCYVCTDTGHPKRLGNKCKIITKGIAEEIALGVRIETAPMQVGLLDHKSLSLQCHVTCDYSYIK